MQNAQAELCISRYTKVQGQSMQVFLYTSCSVSERISYFEPTFIGTNLLCTFAGVVLHHHFFPTPKAIFGYDSETSILR
jgi:hypothetical protein